MTLSKAKFILGEKAKYLTKKELKEIVLRLSNLADIFIDQQKGIVNYGKTNIQ